MSRVTLEFSVPEEQERLHMALHAVDYYSALRDLDQHLRDRLKHEDLPKVLRTALQELRDRICASTTERGIEFP